MYVYIVGRGHSGSTILDMALSQSDGVMGVGELVSGLGRSGEVCSCGSLSTECSFWMDVEQRLQQSGCGSAEEAGNRIRAVSRITKLPLILLGGNGAEYSVNRAVIDALQQAGDHKVVVDSSKEITRSVLLRKLLRRGEYSVIHLVRDPVKMISSNVWRVEQGIGFRFMRRSFKSQKYRPIYITIAAFSWLVGNTIVEMLKLLGYRAIRLRYEDLCLQPESQVERLEQELGVNLAATREFLQGKRAAKITHNLGGNRERHKQEKRFDAARATGRERLGKWEAAWAKVITWPLRKAYGY